MRRRRSNDQSNPNSETGSPLPGEPVYLAIGKLRAAHGIDGEIAMEVYTDFPERLSPGKVVYMGDQYEPLRIRTVRKADKLLLLRFVGHDVRETVNELRNHILYVRRDQLPVLPEGEYYHYQLVGLTVVDESGKTLGTVTDIIETGANDVYVVSAPDGSEILAPAVDEVVLSIDIDKKQMVIRPQEWG